MAFPHLNPVKDLVVTLVGACISLAVELILLFRTKRIYQYFLDSYFQGLAEARRPHEMLPGLIEQGKYTLTIPLLRFIGLIFLSVFFLLVYVLFKN